MSIVLSDYDLFLFDCDGLLVDSEGMHYESFLEASGFFKVKKFPDYHSYRELVGRSLHDLKHYVLEEDPSNLWESLYSYKNQLYIDRLSRNCIELMPGVEELLQRIVSLRKTMAVVTNSSAAMVQGLVQRHPCLKVMESWITRECYDAPKPAPDAYVCAYRQFFYPGIRVIGFEDSLKGLQALAGIPAQAVFVNAFVPCSLIDDVIHIHSLEELISDS